jgi:MoxR-like ATPase
MSASLKEDSRLSSPPIVAEGLERLGYIASPSVATSVYVAAALEKPLLVEGPAGVGKTELAKALAQLLGKPLIRLQCYEGLDEARALYEWKYGKQLLYVQLLKDKIAELTAGTRTLEQALAAIHAQDELFFSKDFLEPRPLLQALQVPGGAVLLVDEVDKADPEFEALLLEVLSDFQVTIPELGTMAAIEKPLVLLTSNRAREMGDALRRRCLHLYLTFPDAALEERIVAAQVPECTARLRAQLVAFVHALRRLDLRKLPAVSETIDWARTLVLLHADQLEWNLVQDTLNVLLKFQEDAEQVLPQGLRLVQEACGDGSHAALVR